MGTFSERLAGLSPAQRRLLAQRLEQQGGGSTPPPLAPAALLPATLPLTVAQQIMWSLSQLWPGQAVCNDPLAFHFHGAFDTAALERTCNAIWQRHAILRATFAVRDGQPAQTIAPLARVPIRWVDLSTLPVAEAETEGQRQMEIEAQTGLDPAQGPLLRLTLYRLAPDHHVLLRTTHHLVSDGWSQGLFIRELILLYEAFAAGAPAPLPDPPVQYHDYALWQHGWLQGAARERQLRFWREHLAGAPAGLELPADHPGPPSPRGAREVRLLPADLVARLRAFSQGAGVTLYTTMLAGLEVLLHHQTGREDFVLGTFGANRTRPEIENLIGWFVNTYLLRARLVGDPSLREVVARAGSVVTGGIYAHPDVALDDAAGVLGCVPLRDRRLPFSVLLAYDLFPHLTHLTQEQHRLGATTVAPVGVPTRSTKCDLGLWVLDSLRGVELAAEHNADRFDRPTMARWLRQYEQILTAFVTDPDQSLSTLRSALADDLGS